MIHHHYETISRPFCSTVRQRPPPRFNETQPANTNDSLNRPTILWKNSSWKEGKGELMTRDNKNSLEPSPPALTPPSPLASRFCGRTSSWPNSANFFHPVPHALWDQLFKMPVISIFNEPGWNPQAPRQIYLPRSNDSDRIREINRVKLEGKAPLDFSRLFEEREREKEYRWKHGEKKKTSSTTRIMPRDTLVKCKWWVASM